MTKAEWRRGAVQDGIALVAVLWIVAALSVAVTGIVYAIRAETRTMSAARGLIEAQVSGEAAIMLALQELTSPQAGPRQPWRTLQVSYGGRVIPVEFNALNGFVDINRAAPELLTVLLATAGGRDVQAAAKLAQSIVIERQKPDALGRAQGFEDASELMRVPGVDYNLYARLRALVTADVQGSGKVNPRAAPLEVLTMLAEGNVARAQSMVSARRQSGGAGIDVTALRAEFIDSGIGSRYRVQALVPMADGSQGVVQLHVDVSPDTRAGLQWRIFNAETWMLASSPKGI